MNRPFTFSSPVSSPDCIQRLQKLVERKHFYVASGLFGVVHVIVESIETSTNSFRLFLKCSTRGDSLLPFIYLRLHGEMRWSNGETKIQLWLKSDQPRSTAEWAFYGFWAVLVTFTLAGGVIGVLTSPPLQGIFIASIYVLAVSGGFWVYRQTYRISVKHLLNLIYHTLRHEGAETQSQETNEVEWLSSLAKSK
jgi:hypothetical protein